MSNLTQSEKAGRPRRVIRILIVLLSILGFLVASLVGVRWLGKQKSARERADWKAPALERLAGLSITNEEIRLELDELKEGATPGRSWAHDHVLLMTNGEYIVYAYRHGANNGSVNHLFLGHSSDERWLYSTYHFCNSMTMIAGEDPPGSIAEFARTYSAREFDGKSDECLQHTWPPNK